MSTTDTNATTPIQQSLRALRARRRLTQADLARGLGTTVLSVNRWENGQARPSARMLRRIDEFDKLGPHEPATGDPGLPSAPGRQPASPAAGNLPRPRAALVGREHELAGVQRLLPNAPLLTLTGAGGCGKTRLALQLAQSAIAEYADGIFLVELAAVSDPALLPNAVAGALGVREETAQPLMDTLAAALRFRGLLLVLDNCEHLIDTCAAMAERLLNACPRLQLIATSREPLRIEAETVFRVPPLALPHVGAEHKPEEMATVPAVALFAQRAQTHAPGFHLDAANAPAVARICRRLDGMPLAIELAAARLAVLSAGQLAKRLDDRFSLLAGGSRTAPARQQTLRATVAWSYDLLDASERGFFDRLSVFAGGFTLTAAEAVATAGLPTPQDAVDLLARLVNKSLVDREDRAGTPRYRLLETLREYGHERLTEAGATFDVLRRHAEYCRDLAERAEPELQGAGQAAWLDLIEAELGNLRSALHWSLTTPAAVETGLRLATAIWRFWLMRGYLSEGRTWIEQSLLNRAARPGVRARALFAAGTLAL
ncbi:MAG: ATP-binding protein, partial [Dehalococcoidia bacterium]